MNQPPADPIPAASMAAFEAVRDRHAADVAQALSMSAGQGVEASLRRR
jgi:hypothetical protein